MGCALFRRGESVKNIVRVQGITKGPIPLKLTPDAGKVTVKIPGHIDWWIWRLLTSEHLKVTMGELERDWSFSDTLDAHDILDAFAAAK